MASCIDDPSERIREKVRIDARQVGSDVIYAGLPVGFVAFSRVNSRDELLSAIWNFGDGNQGDNVFQSHTYFFPGNYRVSLFTENPQNSADTILTVLPERKRIGEINASENGKMLYEHPTAGYRVVHTWNRSSSADAWRFLQVSSSFDSLRSNSLSFESYANVRKMFINSSGNLVVMEQHLWEIDGSGSVINRSETYTYFLDVIETKTGYLAAGYNGSGERLLLRSFDSAFDVISEDMLDIREEGYSPISFKLESEGVIRLLYAENSDADQRARKMVLRQLAGDRIGEKTFDIDKPVSNSIALPSGTFYHGIVSYEYSGPSEYIFVKTDAAGNEQWSIRFPTKLLYLEYQHDGRIEAHEAGDFTYIFFDVMRVAKVNRVGQTEWVKQYGTNYDSFNSAIQNMTGNFVMLGSQQFDYNENNYTTDYLKRDLVLTEIDINGNVVTD
ncbi:PKD domain-containing protein [Chryseolinea sp. H1M3-3]|uniref:PKD domain-containing protein n=1 Tax=Chryseolinea sp. H1M3-3 TaxID=3034144 RepID=UPI0023ED6BC8|nr:PKD domain-containing protein [Chryseolinea sp. H1M3-3]